MPNEIKTQKAMKAELYSKPCILRRFCLLICQLRFVGSKLKVRIAHVDVVTPCRAVRVEDTLQ